MANHKNWRALLKNVSPERQARIKKKAETELAKIALSELRKARHVTQVELARRLGITQPALSQAESQGDMQISTLRKMVEALGGNLEVVVRMPDDLYQLEV